MLGGAMTNKVTIEKLKVYLKHLNEVNPRYDEFDFLVKEIYEYSNLVLEESVSRRFDALFDSAQRIISKMRMIGFLSGLIEKLENADESQNEINQETITTANKSKVSSASSQSVFLVHGHDNKTKEIVARFIEKLGFRVVILHEQPNYGNTIIEKFEAFAQTVSYAIVLLTPDDVGASKRGQNQKKPRARQNVVFELGFFVGLLGRERVCALRKGDVEIPTDYHGVLFIPFDTKNQWKTDLAKQMKSIGMPINIDAIL